VRRTQRLPGGAGGGDPVAHELSGIAQLALEGAGDGGAIAVRRAQGGDVLADDHARARGEPAPCWKGESHAPGELPAGKIDRLLAGVQDLDEFRPAGSRGRLEAHLGKDDAALRSPPGERSAEPHDQGEEREAHPEIIGDGGGEIKLAKARRFGPAR
jgi:hypothetical protein